MPDQLPIRIGRSAGNTWPQRFGPTPPTAPGTVNPNDVAQTVEHVSQQIGPSAAGSVNTGAKTLDDLTDVVINEPKPGDLLRFAGDKWRNYNETNVTDGGNF